MKKLLKSDGEILMTIHDFNGKAGMVSRFTAEEEIPEWRIKIYDEIDNSDYPLFQVEVTIGTRWGRHEYIDFGFDVQDMEDPEKRKDLERLRLEFYNLKQAFDLAYNMFDEASKNVLDKLPKAE